MLRDTTDYLEMLGDLLIDCRKIPSVFFGILENTHPDFYVLKNERSKYYSTDLVAILWFKDNIRKVDASALRTLDSVQHAHDNLLDPDNVVCLNYRFSRVGDCPKDPHTAPTPDLLHDTIELFTYNTEELFAHRPTPQGRIVYAGRRDVIGDELVMPSITNGMGDNEIYIEEKNIIINPHLISKEDARELVNRLSTVTYMHNISQPYNPGIPINLN